MAIISGTKVYSLGRECKLEVEGVELDGVADVSIRQFTTEIDATGFNHQVTSSLVVARTFEIQLTVPDMATARYLYGLRNRLVDGKVVQNAVEVTMSQGLFEFTNLRFVITEIDGDEPLDGVVMPRFVLKRWGHDNA